jgi:hypothetical protein
VVSRARLVRRVETWNDRTARLFAADCAEHVLPLFETKYHDDKRPRQAIQAARDYANGKIIKKQLAAARDAAWAAARDAGDAWDAWAAWAARAARAAWAARDAARAAWAARDAARAAARAARDAWAAGAAWAARDAARAAAWGAAWAARDAARAAERKWQTARLMDYLYPEEGEHA